MTDPDALGRECRRLRARLDELRSSWLLARGGPETEAIAEAAFLELDAVCEALRASRENAGEPSAEIPPAEPVAERDRRLLRAAFMQSPVPALLLEGEEGVVTWANDAALGLLGQSRAYLGGRPLAVLVDLRTRAAFRSALTAVARLGGRRELDGRLVTRLRPVHTRILLTRLEAHGADRPQILVTAPGTVPAESAESAGSSSRPLDDIVSQTRRADLLGSVAGVLADAGLGARDLLDRVVELLAGEFGAFAAADVVAGEELRRVAVHGGGEGEKTLWLTETGRGMLDLPGRVRATGRTVIKPHFDDARMLGTDGEGVPVAARLDAVSLVCSPLGVGGDAPGVVTVVWPAAAGPCAMAEAALVEEVCALTGRALRSRPGGPG
ncbi:PAS domain-containing protein [Streptosporangium becharense]|uniref:PAS domain-containing protein n=1 Tax=Streptosporangium becharense TaxID=1816182 RepID=A0A7W9IDZ2_9ACTN|nr:PAS domain-containing protein [Streptosporangium becharense]MBB2912199.1 PAS domain-containing protein [Streptosporangium becharense]MBB5818746.1 PAS domain-containing protein [Streptosporangium becharense]